MVRLRLDLAYDGGAFYGWARQPTLRTVQGELEQALHTILRVSADDPDEPLRLTVAGRTDTGVHALHQVCHLDVGEATLDRCKECARALISRFPLYAPEYEEYFE